MPPFLDDCEGNDLTPFKETDSHSARKDILCQELNRKVQSMWARPMSRLPDSFNSITFKASYMPQILIHLNLIAAMIFEGCKFRSPLLWKFPQAHNSSIKYKHFSQYRVLKNPSFCEDYRFNGRDVMHFGRWYQIFLGKHVGSIFRVRKYYFMTEKLQILDFCIMILLSFTAHITKISKEPAILRNEATCLCFLNP
jgi:hypothetical protein